MGGEKVPGHRAATPHNATSTHSKYKNASNEEHMEFPCMPKYKNH